MNPSSPPTPLFDVQQLRKHYGAATVVDDVSFQIHPGECLGVIGPNGAGKTTTIRMCLGLTAPDAGSIHYYPPEGGAALAMPRDALAIKQQLGVVTQFDTLDPDFTCAENLRVYGRYFGLPRATLDERIPQLLEFAALTHKADAKPGELSGGMKRRLSLARALVNDPRLLLLDEPTTGVGALAVAAAAGQVHFADHPLHGRGRAPVLAPAGARPWPQDRRRSTPRADRRAPGT